MGHRYVTTGSQNAASLATILGLTSSTSMRPRLYEVIFGSATAPADVAMEIALLRYSGAGTGTSVTPKPVDPADVVSNCTAQEKHTVEPTYPLSTAMQEVGINQQATWRWVTPPYEGIAMPALASNGIGIRFVTVSAGTPLCQVTFSHDE